MQFPPDLVIFDCDGVLVDSEPLSHAVLRDNLARHGLDLPLARISDLFVGGTIMGVRDTACGMGARLPDDWVAAIYAEIFAVLAEKVEPVPGIFAVLDALDAAGVPYAVGSNGPHRKMEITLARTGLRERLEGRIVSREDVARPKPAPDIYLRAAAIAQVAPARALVIEDSPSGARGAQAAGITCFGYVAGSDRAQMAPLCARLFDRMDQLPGLIFS
jgi:HAD superfamily hydrolase (TIGR01509 family)